LATWKIFAHEVGHNFGGPHVSKTVGGIMGGGEVFKFGSNNVCSYVSSRLNSMVGGVKCLPDIDVICGNGILEPGEECDGDSCCGSNCMFLPTAYCSYQYFTAGTDGSKVLITNECCNSKCKPTGTNLCDKGDSDSTKSVDQGYCWNGEFQCVIYFNLYFIILLRLSSLIVLLLLGFFYCLFVSPFFVLFFPQVFARKLMWCCIIGCVGALMEVTNRIVMGQHA
jgi:hypothetical protein